MAYLDSCSVRSYKKFIYLKNKKMRKYIYLLLLVLLSSACKKNESSVNNTQPTTVTPPILKTESTFGPLPGATFYSDASYGGTAVLLNAGTYTKAQLVAKGIPDNSASSVKVPFGVKVTMYQDDNLTGTSWTFTSDISNFTTLTPNANDQMSSCKVELYATCYQNTNFGGTASQPLTVGSYTLAQLNAKGIPNDWVHSIKVPRGLIVILFADDNFQGKASTFTADDGTMSYVPYNNIAGLVSSCKVIAAPGEIAINPSAKSGYTLTMADEFSGTSLDTTKWSPYYFRGRTSTDAEAAAVYSVSGGVLNLKILDATTHSNSGIQSVEDYQMHFLGGRVIPRKILFAQKYGYFEARIKTQHGSGSCSSFWMIGAQDGGTIESAEADIIEQPGSYGDYGYPTHYTDHTLGGGGVTEAAVYDHTLPNLTDCYNVYALEWTPTVMNYYFNNVLYWTTPNRTNYRMGVVLSTYNASSGFFGTIDPTVPYPKVMQVDYFRAYSKNP